MDLIRMFKKGITALLLLTIGSNHGAVLIDGADVIFHGGVHHGGDAGTLPFSTQLLSGCARRPQTTSNISLVLGAHHSDQSQQVPRSY